MRPHKKRRQGWYKRRQSRWVSEVFTPDGHHVVAIDRRRLRRSATEYGLLVCNIGCFLPTGDPTVRDIAFALFPNEITALLGHLLQEGRTL